MSTGAPHWRDVASKDDAERLRALAETEFPGGVEASPIDRRRFLALAGASLGLAGLSGCMRAPAEKIVPFVHPVEGRVPGKPLYYATSMTLAGSATGLLVESYEGRPIKVEGNPAHPSSLGATDVFAQASVLGLYDPDRSKTVTYLGRPRIMGDLAGPLREALATAKHGKGLRILTETVGSPSLIRQRGELLERYPEARWHSYEPAMSGAASAGARMVFDQSVRTHYDLSKADVLVALDADFLGSGPGHLRYAHDFAARRREPLTAERMNRLYAVEPTPTITGARADHRLPVLARDVIHVARALANALGIGKWTDAPPDAATASFVQALADDLRSRRPGTTLVVAGDNQPAALAALVQAINRHLGNFGGTVLHTGVSEAPEDAGLSSLVELASDMREGRVTTLVNLSGNPVYTAPADLGFADAMKRVPLCVHLGLYQDETADYCQWHIPEAHYLEAWGDARGHDGTASIAQPLIAPLYAGKSALEVVGMLSGEPGRSGYEMVRETWQAHGSKQAGGFETWWRRTLHEGVIAGSASPTIEPRWRDDWQARAGLNGAAPARNAGPLEIVFRPDPTVFDGRFANNGWLQELPKPLTKLTWENVALISPATAQALGIKAATEGPHAGSHGEAIAPVVELTYGGQTLRAPAWVFPGQADGSIAVHLGYGRTRAGTLGSNIGFDANRLRASAAPHFGPGLDIRTTTTTTTLACTQLHQSMVDRQPVRTADLATFLKEPRFAQESAHTEGGDRRHPLTLYPDDHPMKGPQWGMVVDLNACTGCGACVVACQAENNISVVGKEQVARGREMHWMRIDRYFSGDSANPTAHVQPVMCMHCENAPCELVCPVEATTHSPDGLNEMTYNRCVGTRYCSNNCPYKVRRFNFLAFADYATASLKLLRNPDVTVRSRGVMEKCTYCVQRIREAEIDANNRKRPLRDGDVITACQAVCPTRAIVFGDIHDANSQVAKLRESQRNYGLLEELNTRPRTTYLASVRNPNPRLETR